MHFEPNSLYHVYNRTFRGARAFITPENYLFLRKKLSSLTSICDILAYCLMPSHFHLLINVPEASHGLTRIRSGNTPPGMQYLSRKLGSILSSYTRAINIQESRDGSLFQPRSKAKLLDLDHAYSCFQYIHANPVKAGLVFKLENWKYSSFNEYYRDWTGLCNKRLAIQLLGLPEDPHQFYQMSNNIDISMV